MKNDTVKLTSGAMFVAIFAIMLLINRQTGAIFENVIMYLLPIPMVAYSAKFGPKPSFPVLAAMGLISLLFGTVTTIYYAVSEALIGLIFGSCIYKKISMNKTLFWVLILSVIAQVLNTIVLASLFGYNLATEAAEMKTMMFQTIEQTGMSQNVPEMQVVLETILTPDYLIRIIILSTIIFGLVQGFIVYQVSLLILNRLKFNLPKPASLYSFFPPRWTGVLAIGIYCVYLFTYNLVNPQMQVILQTTAICCFLFLLFFGILCLLLIARVHLTRNKLLLALIAFIGYIMLSQFLIFLGLFYIVSEYHSRLLARDQEAVRQLKEIEEKYRTNSRPIQ